MPLTQLEPSDKKIQSTHDVKPRPEIDRTPRYQSKRDAIDEFEEDEEANQSIWRRYRMAFVVGGVMLVFAGVGIKLLRNVNSTPRRESSIVLVALPPPPPPPPVQQPPPEQKLEETFQPEEKPEEEPPKPPDQPPIGTNIKGDGSSNAFGLGNSGNGLGGAGQNGSRFGWYAGQVQAKISEAMRNNRKTRAASMSLQARIWADATGRVTRAQLAGSSGDSGLDSAVRDEVLTGLQLREPPPDGMPMPIVLRLTARRSN